jgi:alkylated DNA repair dioxygenase AlkB
MVSMRAVEAASQDAPITFIPNFLDQETADQAFVTLLAEIPWERRTTEMYGKNVPVPRMEVWVADHPYTYSRRTYQPTAWTPTLVKLKADIETATRTKFNSVLLNRYEDENDSVGWHADDEPEMSQEHAIASLSLGATRSFQMRKGDRPIQTIELVHGSLLVMHPRMQQEWKHRVPKTMKPLRPPHQPHVWVDDFPGWMILAISRFRLDCCPWKMRES